MRGREEELTRFFYSSSGSFIHSSSLQILFKNQWKVKRGEKFYTKRSFVSAPTFQMFKSRQPSISLLLFSMDDRNKIHSILKSHNWPLYPFFAIISSHEQEFGWDKFIIFLQNRIDWLRRKRLEFEGSASKKFILKMAILFKNPWVILFLIILILHPPFTISNGNSIRHVDPEKIEFPLNSSSSKIYCCPWSYLRNKH